jgi:hypothetical protein
MKGQRRVAVSTLERVRTSKRSIQFALEALLHSVGSPNRSVLSCLNTSISSYMWGLALTQFAFGAIIKHPLNAL